MMVGVYSQQYHGRSSMVHTSIDQAKHLITHFPAIFFDHFDHLCLQFGVLHLRIPLKEWEEPGEEQDTGLLAGRYPFDSARKL